MTQRDALSCAAPLTRDFNSYCDKCDLHRFFTFFCLMREMVQERLTLHLRRGNDPTAEEGVFVLEYSVPSDACPRGLPLKQVRFASSR